MAICSPGFSILRPAPPLTLRSAGECLDDSTPSRRPTSSRMWDHDRLWNPRHRRTDPFPPPSYFNHASMGRGSAQDVRTAMLTNSGNTGDSSGTTTDEPRRRPGHFWTPCQRPLRRRHTAFWLIPYGRMRRDRLPPKNHRPSRSQVPDYVPSSARARTRWPVAVGRSLARAKRRSIQPEGRRAAARTRAHAVGPPEAELGT